MSKNDTTLEEELETFYKDHQKDYGEHEPITLMKFGAHVAMVRTVKNFQEHTKEEISNMYNVDYHENRIEEVN